MWGSISSWHLIHRWTCMYICVALKSSDNIPIEALWSYFLKYTGHNLKAAILLGKTENYINVANELHMCVVKFCAVLFLIACRIEIYFIGCGPELCKMPSTNLCDTGTLIKLESRATSICLRVLHLRRSFSIQRTLGFATQAFQWISMWSANLEIRFQSPGRTAFVGFHLTLIHVWLRLTNPWECRHKGRRGSALLADLTSAELGLTTADAGLTAVGHVPKIGSWHQTVSCHWFP
jgi:hypothetical protein